MPVRGACVEALLDDSDSDPDSGSGWVVKVGWSVVGSTWCSSSHSKCGQHLSGEKTGLQLGMWSGFSWHSTMTQRMMDASHEQDCWHGLGTGTSAPSAYVTLFNKQLPSPGMALVPDEGVVNESSSPVVDVVVISDGGASVSSVEAAVCGTVWWLDGAPVVADESPPSTGEEVVTVGSCSSSSTMVVGESDDVLPIITSKSLESVTSGAGVSSASGAPVTLLEDSVLDGPWLSVDWLSVEDALIGALPSVDESGSTSVTLTTSSGRSVGLSLSSALTEASVTAAESVADGIPWAESVEVSALVSGASVSIADSDAGVVDEGGVLPCAAAASVEDSASVGAASELVGVVAAVSDASATDESVGSCESTDETVVDGSWMKSVAAVAVVVDE